MYTQCTGSVTSSYTLIDVAIFKQKCVVTCIVECTCCIYTLLGNVLFICKFVYNLMNAITIRI